MELMEWLKRDLHLPRWFRDFHDQKAVFKRVGEEVARAKDGDRCGILDGYNWILLHVLVVDYFLHFMALHGWTLQRSRAPVEFYDLETTMRDFERRDAAASREMLIAALEKPNA